MTRTDFRLEKQQMSFQDDVTELPEQPANQRCAKCGNNPVLGGMLLLDGRASCGMCAETEDPDAPAAYVIGEPLPATDDEESHTNA